MSHPIQQAGGGVRLSLPWPDRRLSPNARVHWRAKYQATAAAKAVSYYLAREQIGRQKFGWERPHLTWQFCPPSRRRYDVDNLIAQHKAAQDGIADALGVDDSKFISTYSMGEPVKGGAVLVTIAPRSA